MSRAVLTLLACALVVVIGAPAAAAASAPSVAATAATGIDPVSATLTGTVDPNLAQVTDCHFEIAPPPRSGERVPCGQQVGSGDDVVVVSASLTNLGPAVTYTYTLVVESSMGRVESAPATFKTVTVPPDGPEIGPKDVTWSSKLRVSAKGVVTFAMHNHLAITLGVASVVVRGAVKKTKAKAKPKARAVAAAAKPKPKPKPPLIAQTLAPTLKALHTTKLSAKLTRSGLKRLKAKKRLRVTLSVVVVAPDGIRSTFTRTTTITAPRKRK